MGQLTTDTRTRILDTALELFAAHGYQRTSLRQIADRLGLSKAAVLYHFPAKDRIMAALTDPMLRDLEAALDRAALRGPVAAPWAAVEELMDAFLAHRQTLVIARHDLSIMTHQPDVYRRFFAVGMRAHELIAGPGAGLAERVRAAQVMACLSDPVMFYADAPVELLRGMILDGARRVLTASSPAPGTVAAPARGRRGRPRALDGERLATARRMYRTGGLTVTEIARALGVSRATLYRRLGSSESQ